MQKRGQITFAFFIVLLLVLLVTATFIEPMKGTLDSTRGYSSGLNCPGTPDFNQTAYDDDTSFDRLVYRPTCFVTGVSMVWLIGGVVVYGCIWLFENWRKSR